jgi:hypothetical protein
LRRAENSATAGGSIFMPNVFGYINKTLMPIKKQPDV